MAWDLAGNRGRVVFGRRDVRRSSSNDAEYKRRLGDFYRDAGEWQRARKTYAGVSTVEAIDAAGDLELELYYRRLLLRRGLPSAMLRLGDLLASQGRASGAAARLSRCDRQRPYLRVHHARRRASRARRAESGRACVPRGNRSGLCSRGASAGRTVGPERATHRKPSESSTGLLEPASRRRDLRSSWSIGISPRREGTDAESQTPSRTSFSPNIPRPAHPAPSPRATGTLAARSSAGTEHHGHPRAAAGEVRAPRPRRRGRARAGARSRARAPRRPPPRAPCRRGRAARTRAAGPPPRSPGRRRRRRRAGRDPQLDAAAGMAQRVVEQVRQHPLQRDRVAFERAPGPLVTTSSRIAPGSTVSAARRAIAVRSTGSPACSSRAYSARENANRSPTRRSRWAALSWARASERSSPIPRSIASSEPRSVNSGVRRSWAIAVSRKRRSRSAAVAVPSAPFERGGHAAQRVADLRDLAGAGGDGRDRQLAAGDPLRAGGQPRERAQHPALQQADREHEHDRRARPPPAPSATAQRTAELSRRTNSVPWMPGQRDGLLRAIRVERPGA